MEIENIEIESHGDKIIIPDGCNGNNKDNEIIIDKYQKECKHTFTIK